MATTADTEHQNAKQKEPTKILPRWEKELLADAAKFASALKPEAKRQYEEYIAEYGVVPLIRVDKQSEKSASWHDWEQDLENRPTFVVSSSAITWTAELISLMQPNDATLALIATPLPARYQAVIDTLAKRAGVGQVVGILEQDPKKMPALFLSREGTQYMRVPSRFLNDDLAGVVGHEIGHIALKHMDAEEYVAQANSQSEDVAKSRAQERDADQFAAAMCVGKELAKTLLRDSYTEIKYNALKSGVNLAEYFEKTGHPNTSERIADVVNTTVALEKQGKCPLPEAPKPGLPSVKAGAEKGR